MLEILKKINKGNLSILDLHLLLINTQKSYKINKEFILDSYSKNTYVNLLTYATNKHNNTLTIIINNTYTYTYTF